MSRSLSLICLRRPQHFNNLITKNGIYQLKNLKLKWKKKKEIELVITGNDNISVISAHNIFRDNDIPIVKINDLQKDLFFKFVQTRNESSISFIGDNNFINELKCTNPNYNVHELRRLYPYLIELSFIQLCGN